jgi:metal-responsive CopG/Arc/MetJ family transcriptional regulator
MDFKQLGAEEEDEWVRVEVQMPRSLLTKIDAFREEWGVKSRGAIVAGLLQELLSDEPID